MDTPHMKALKIRRYNLLKNLEGSKRNILRESGSTKNKTKRLLDKSFSEKLRKDIEKEARTRSSKDADPDVKELSSYIEVEDPEGLTLPEQNLENFEKAIRSRIALFDKFPSKEVKEKAQTTQVQTWKKALDNRLWARKVDEVGLLLDIKAS
jgi:hypothetical protein